ncbi:MAG: 16S rRNA (adenine(1518)-N(6)/adenine(1519)-N(6))-dimethyltransferase RsmA [Thermodesulfobacteriota bacterium]
MNRSDIKSILKNNELAPKKKLGQNFLVHQATSERIVELAGVTKEDTVFEIGVGLGSLTSPLAQRAGKVIGIEVDAGIVRYHTENNSLPANTTLVHQDILKTDFNKLAAESGGPLKIIANLPYSISNPLLFKLLDHKELMSWAVLMLQKEVGMRLCAAPGTKEYGVLSVLFASCATVKDLLHVSPEQFHPRPKVDSVVVKISFHPPAQADYNNGLFVKVVKTGFQKRRKTLVNCLATSSLISLTKKQAFQVLEKAEISIKARGETLTVNDYIRLTNVIQPLL